MVLSGLLPIDSHLASKALCDVALDTYMFNGHTTGADTLWTGTPLITLASEQMRSRAGASMARALGVTCFITRTLQDYEAVAVRLASSPTRLARAKRRMEEALETSPFFDTALWAKVARLPRPAPCSPCASLLHFAYALRPVAARHSRL